MLDPIPTDTLDIYAVNEELSGVVALDENHLLAIPEGSGEQDREPSVHFEVVRAVLKRLLGDDSDFHVTDLSDPTTQLDSALLRLYQSPRTRTLVSRLKNCPEETLNHVQIHQFFADIAWLNESSLTTPHARAQYDAYLYDADSYWSPAIVLGEGDYSELGELLKPIPEDLRHWMIQFKRGARFAPIVEWISAAPARVLYQGMAAAIDAESPFQVVVSRLFSTQGSYQDKALLDSLTQQLDSSAAWLMIIDSLSAMPLTERGTALLPIDMATPISSATRRVFLRQVAEYAMNPDGQPWLSEAISSAETTSSMRALSLAIRLRQVHPDITSEVALRTASMLLTPVEHLETESARNLPELHALVSDLSPLNSWNPQCSADELFLTLGVDLLSQTEGSARELSLPAHEAWEALFQTVAFNTTFAPLLAKMGWYGSVSADQPSAQVTQALAGHAIVGFFLLDPKSASESIERFIYSRQASEYSHVALAGHVRKMIMTRQPQASPATVSLLMYLLLREMAPELLVQNVPDFLNYGRSLQSVSLLQGVCLLEALAPGTAQRSQFDDVLITSAQTVESSDPVIRELWAKTQVLPAMRYAVAHGAIPWADADDIRQASPAQIMQALAFLTKQQNLHAQALHNLLSLKAPDRERMARHQLAEAKVDPNIWDAGPAGDAIFIYLERQGMRPAAGYEWSRLLATGGELGLGRQATVLELVMMGELQAVAKPTVPDLYEQASTAYHTAMTQAERPIIRRLLEEMPSAQRALLATSTSEVSRLRFASEEGEHGVFIRCQSGDHRHDFHLHVANEETFFEIIPAAGVARQVPQAFDYQVPVPEHTYDLVMDGAREDLYHQARAVAHVMLLNPVDSDAYLSGSVSRSAAQPNNPLNATLVPGPVLTFLPNASEASALDAVAAAATEHLLVAAIASIKALNTHETGWEQTWDMERKIADFTARLIIPFYGCIKDLAAGDRSAGVLIGCATDIVFALVPMGQFVGSTARVVLRAGELSVVSIAEAMAKEMGTLVKGLAEQSGIFLLRDVAKLSWNLSALSMKLLVKQVPALARIFSKNGDIAQLATLRSGMYLFSESLEHAHVPRAENTDQRAIVDGIRAVAVRNIGTLDAPVFRLLDPYGDKAFGPALKVLSSGESLELAHASAWDGLSVGTYPHALPVIGVEHGGFELLIADACEASVLERETGVFDVIVDGHHYHLNSTVPEPVLRMLSVEKLSARANRLEASPMLCRPGRDLIPGTPCADFVRLVLPAIEAPTGAGAMATLGQHSSAAFSAREYQLARVSPLDSAAPALDLLTHEGKVCKWDHEVIPGKGRRPAQLSADKKLIPLTAEEKAGLALPEQPVYLEHVSGRLSLLRRLGVSPDVTESDVLLIFQTLPTVELQGIAQGVADARTLRALQLDIDGSAYLFVEADVGLFYRAPKTPSGELAFSRVVDDALINRYLFQAEQYRLVAERTSILQDRENIARLLFDLEKDTAEFKQQLLLGKTATYEEYKNVCEVHELKNELHGYAEKLLTGEIAQQRFVRMAKSSIADFKRVGDRDISGKEHHIEVLNRLLPLQTKAEGWVPLTVDSIALAGTAEKLSIHVRGANFAYAMVETAEGQRFVYYSFSGGKKAKGFKFKLQLPDRDTQVIEGVTYIDAGIRMRGRAPDPEFTSLPVLRDADHLTILDMTRYLDSERLIATILKQDLQGAVLRDIHFFTLMDTCRSCGGVILPQTRLMFPGVNFSVSYLKDYDRV